MVHAVDIYAVPAMRERGDEISSVAEIDENCVAIRGTPAGGFRKKVKVGADMDRHDNRCRPYAAGCLHFDRQPVFVIGTGEIDPAPAKQKCDRKG